MEANAVKKTLFAATTVLLVGIGVYAASTTLMAKSAQDPALADDGPFVRPTCEFLPDRPNRSILPIDVKAQRINLTAVDGQSVEWANLLQKGPVLVEFFASWCPHCQHSVPGVKALQHDFADHLSIVAVNAGDRPEQPSTSLEFKEKYGITYPILEKVGDSLLDDYCLSGFPTFYLIDASGKVVWRYLGTLEGLELEALKGKIEALTH